MKKTITIVLLFISVLTYSQKVSERINKLEKEVEKLNDSIDKLKQDESSLYHLKQNLIKDNLDYHEVKRKYFEINTKIDDKLDNWFIKYVEAILAIFGLAFGVVAWFRSKKITHETILEEIETKIAKLTGIEEVFIHKNLNEYKKHINIKNTAKIIVLNEKGTDFPEGFKNVLNLYKGYNQLKNKVDVIGLEDCFKPENLEILKNSDLVIIENQIEMQNNKEKHWKLANIKDLNTIEAIEAKMLSKSTAIDRLPYKNILSLIKLGNTICNKTAIVYYGQQGKGFFPSNFMDSNKQHHVTFASAPSQLYGNILNMLKFKSELNNAKN